jgi:hypothetical protein
LLGCDGVVLTGTTTSGCVRATAVDALSQCDLHAKYADAVKTVEVLSFFADLPDALFDLPAGTMGASTKMAAE